MFRRISWSLVFCMLLMTVIHASAGITVVGSKAPSFSVVTPDDERVTLDMLKGKVVIMFYETRQTSKKNSDMRERLNNLYLQQPEHIKKVLHRLPVFNLSGVIWPVTEVYRMELRKHSRRTNVPLYIDLKGAVQKDFQLPGEESNMVIIDRKGIVRMHLYGKIADEKYHEIKALLDHLVNGESL